MSLDQKVGSRRNFLLNNHRLNKDAVLQILEDVMETVNNANVALLGRPDPDTSATHGVTAAGCDGVWQYSVDTSGGVVIHFNDPGYLVYGAQDLNGKACTKVVLYDPASTSQASTSVNVTAYAGTPGTQCFLWFRREEANVDVDAEYRWQTGTGEVFQSTPTMRREYVEFAVTGTSYHPTYNEENGYFKFARIREWLSATSPNLEFIHFTDRKGIAISNSNLTPFGGFYGITGGIGLVGIVKDIVNLLYMISDSDWNINLVNGAVAAAGQAGWYHRPEFGLKQIAELLPRAKSAVLAQGVVTYNSGSHTYSLAYSRNADDNLAVNVVATTQVIWTTSSSTSGAGYKCTMTVSNVPSNWSVTGIFVTSHLPGYSFPGSRLNTLWVASPSTSLPFFGDGATDFNIDVMPYSTVATGDAELVYAAAGSFSFQIIGYWE